MISSEIIRIACEYYKQGNSLKETAEFLNRDYNFNIHPNTLGYYLKKTGLNLRRDVEGVILRTRKHIDVKKILENYNNNTPIRKLSRDLKVARGTIRKILVENGWDIIDSRSAQLAIGYIKEKKKFVLSSQEKAYLYGLVLGDLTPVKKSNYTIKLITHSTHKSFIELLYKTFKDYGVTNYKETKHNSLRFQTYICLESFSFLLDCKKGIMPDWIKSDNFFDFLAGFIDSDGSVMLKRAGKNVFYSIRFFGQNLTLLNEIKSRLTNLGFDSSIHLSHKKGYTNYRNGIMFRYNKDYYILETRKRHTIDLLKKIPVRHPEKIMKRELIFKINSKNISKWSEIEEEIYKVRRFIRQTAY